MGPVKKEFIFVIAVIARKDSQSAKSITKGARLEPLMFHKQLATASVVVIFIFPDEIASYPGLTIG